jgi:serine/threonine protein kinase
LSDRLRIVEVLGGGAFATVVVVEHADGLRRACKVLRPDRVDDLDAVYRFRDEAHILQRVDHPHVVHCHGLHPHGRRLVMELDFVDGASLEELLGSGELHQLSPRAAAEVVAQAASALHAVFEHPFADQPPLRIVHRDVRPANLLLGADGLVRVVDFGIAKGDFAEREALSLFDVGGSMGFIAPERKGGGDSPAVDVYALGVLWVWMLSGRQLLLPMRPERHREAVAERVDALQLSHEGADETRALLRAMIDFDAEVRPSMGEVQDQARQLAARSDGEDLEEVARRWVRRVQADRPTVAVREHRRFDEVAFLEHTATGAAPRPGQREARRRLEQLLSTPDWLDAVRTVAELRGAAVPPIDGPLLRRLDRARPSWWRLVGRVTRPEEIEQLLLILADRPTEATLARARKLASHPDERVRRAATWVLQRGEST